MKTITTKLMNTIGEYKWPLIFLLALAIVITGGFILYPLTDGQWGLYLLD